MLRSESQIDLGVFGVCEEAEDHLVGDQRG